MDKHIRHPLSHYMGYVEKWWVSYEQQQQLAGKDVSSFGRTLYVATDVLSVVLQLRQDYPSYHISNDEESTNHSSSTIRYDKEIVRLCTTCVKYYTGNISFIMSAYAGGNCLYMSEDD